jgi:hypothetical protein
MPVAASGASRRAPSDARQNGRVQLPRFWIAMQIVIIVCVLISAVIVIVKL